MNKPRRIIFIGASFLRLLTILFPASSSGWHYWLFGRSLRHIGCERMLLEWLLIAIAAVMVILIRETFDLPKLWGSWRLRWGKRQRSSENIAEAEQLVALPALNLVCPFGESVRANSREIASGVFCRQCGLILDSSHSKVSAAKKQGRGGTDEHPQEGAL
jgi:hypothetical protein